MTVASGRLITIEGLDGAGKTTLCVELERVLARRGLDVVRMREPGTVALSERIRELIADPAHTVDPRAEALLFAAARAQLCAEVIEPTLAAGRWILLDRFYDSSLAYQGAGRGLPVDEVAALNRFATAGRRPDRTLLLRLAPDQGRARITGRAGPRDRIEAEQEHFFLRVAAGYDRLANHEPDRFRMLDACAPREEVLDAALGALSDLMPDGGGDAGTSD